MQLIGCDLQDMRLTMKKLIDIEKLVQWTLRDEIPKGFRMSVELRDVVKRRLYRRGQLIAHSIRATQRQEGDNFGRLPGEPTEDARIVADAISSIETNARIASRREALRLLGDWSPIAGESLQPILGKPFDAQELVINYGLKANRPPWEFEQPKPLPITILTGSIRRRETVVVEGLNEWNEVVALSPRRGKAAMTHGRFSIDSEPRTPLRWPGLDAIGVSRAEYFVWQAALCRLAINLTGKLSHWEPTPPIARPMPWITGQGGITKALSGRTLGVEILTLPLQPKRHAEDRLIESDVSTISKSRSEVLRLPPAKRRIRKTLD